MDGAEDLDVTLLVNEVALDNSEHPAGPLSNQHVAQYLALELKVARVENDVADYFHQHQRVFKDRNRADALAVEYFH